LTTSDYAHKSLINGHRSGICDGFSKGSTVNVLNTNKKYSTETFTLLKINKPHS